MLEDFTTKAQALLVQFDQLMGALRRKDVAGDIPGAKHMLGQHSQLRESINAAAVDSLIQDAHVILKRLDHSRSLNKNVGECTHPSNHGSTKSYYTHHSNLRNTPKSAININQPCGAMRLSSWQVGHDTGIWTDFNLALRCEGKYCSPTPRYQLRYVFTLLTGIYIDKLLVHCPYLRMPLTT